jgi:hypothetical protein
LTGCHPSPRIPFFLLVEEIKQWPNYKPESLFTFVITAVIRTAYSFMMEGFELRYGQTRGEITYIRSTGTAMTL